MGSSLGSISLWAGNRGAIPHIFERRPLGNDAQGPSLHVLEFFVIAPIGG